MSTAAAATSVELESARTLATANKLAEAEFAYRNLLETPLPPANNEKAIQIQEQALYELGKLYCDHKYVFLIFLMAFFG